MAEVDHLLWFTILAQQETNDVILYINSVHKHWGNTFQRQNYKSGKKDISKKDLFYLHGIYSIQTSLF
jgi:hypothetical protein